MNLAFSIPKWSNFHQTRHRNSTDLVIICHIKIYKYAVIERMKKK